MKKRDIVIDADHILFNVTESKTYKDGLDGDVVGKIDLDPYKRHFESIVNDYILTAEVESIAYGWKIGKVRVILSDHTNFRYDIFPEYKNGRPPTPKLRKRLKKWAMKKYHFEPNTEADDVVAYYVRKGAIGFTTDKDLLYGVEGMWYNSHYMHNCWVHTNKEDAEFFFKMQVLGGDSGDDIPSLDGIALGKAEKLLIKYGDDWGTILKIFKDPKMIPSINGKDRNSFHDKDYMVCMTRLVCMSQWTPKHGVRLWKFPKD